VPACGTDARGAALAVDVDGPRTGKVPAGAGDDLVPAGGGQPPAAELFRRPRFRRGGVGSDVWRRGAGPAGRRRGLPLTSVRRWAPGPADCATIAERADDASTWSNLYRHMAE